jgi:hypothetical protein
LNYDRAPPTRECGHRLIRSLPLQSVLMVRTVPFYIHLARLGERRANMFPLELINWFLHQTILRAGVSYELISSCLQSWIFVSDPNSETAICAYPEHWCRHSRFDRFAIMLINVLLHVVVHLVPERPRQEERGRSCPARSI